MVKNILRWLVTILGLIIGYFISSSIVHAEFFKKIINVTGNSFLLVLCLILGTILFGLIFYFVALIIVKLIFKITEFIETGVQKVPTSDFVIGIIGLIIGLLIAFLLISTVSRFLVGSSSYPLLGLIGTVISLIVEVIFGTLGVNIALRKKEDLYAIFTSWKRLGRKRKPRMIQNYSAEPKILDTSVIIDGRIFDILKTNFVDGPIIIPSFVLQELRHIADSSDNLKRTRGRRGLDILNQIQNELTIPVEISEKDFDNVQEVDSKLLKLAQTLNGKVITNDFNLNKVAEFQKVPVLNINELANAVKPVVIPGEEMHIRIVKDGKESGQGVAYLDDGTMIVVEGGKKYVGEEVDVLVTSVLQTAAGRMIFGKIKNVQDKAV